MLLSLPYTASGLSSINRPSLSASGTQPELDLRTRLARLIMFIRKPKPWHYNENDDAVPRDPVPNPYDHTKQEWRFRGNRCIFRHEQAVEAGESTAKSTVAGGFDKVACGAFTLGRCEASTECPLSHTVRDDVIVAPKIAIVSGAVL